MQALSDCMKDQILVLAEKSDAWATTLCQGQSKLAWQGLYTRSSPPFATQLLWPLSLNHPAMY